MFLIYWVIYCYIATNIHRSINNYNNINNNYQYSNNIMLKNNINNLNYPLILKLKNDNILLKTNNMINYSNKNNILRKRNSNDGDKNIQVNNNINIKINDNLKNNNNSQKKVNKNKKLLITVLGFSKKTNEADLREIFEVFENIIKINRKIKTEGDFIGIAFIKFEKEEDARKVINLLILLFKVKFFSKRFL